MSDFVVGVAGILLVVLLVILLVCSFLFVTFLFGDAARVRHYRNRIWCICRVEKRIGLVPRDVLDRASQDEWRLVRRSKILSHIHSNQRDGKLISPYKKNIIVVKAGSPEHITLVQNHFIERGSFWVPETLTQMTRAYWMMNGKFWDGKFVES